MMVASVVMHIVTYTWMERVMIAWAMSHEVFGSALDLETASGSEIGWAFCVYDVVQWTISTTNMLVILIAACVILEPLLHWLLMVDAPLLSLGSMHVIVSLGVESCCWAINIILVHHVAAMVNATMRANLLLLRSLHIWSLKLWNVLVPIHVLSWLLILRRCSDSIGGCLALILMIVL